MSSPFKKVQEFLQGTRILMHVVMVVERNLMGVFGNSPICCVKVDDKNKEILL